MSFDCCCDTARLNWIISTGLRLMCNPLFFHEAILYSAVTLYTSDIILLVDCSSRPCLYFCLSLHPSFPPHSPSIRPPIWLRWGVVGRGEWSGARDGATAGAQSDKERQITPLTRAIHHLFIAPFFHPSLPPHLVREILRTWRATPEKKKQPWKKPLTNLPHNFTLDTVLI